jgi:HSP20 family protein
MNIVQWKPFGELDQIFDDRFSAGFPKVGLDLAIDLYEEKGNVIAKMSLPGIQANELEVSVENDTLTITGRREEEKETEKKDYYSKEIRRGSFSRSISLPSLVDAEKTTAEYKDGVLMVSMPVVTGKQRKLVKVTVQKS